MSHFGEPQTMQVCDLCGTGLVHWHKPSEQDRAKANAIKGHTDTVPFEGCNQCKEGAEHPHLGGFIVVKARKSKDTCVLASETKWIERHKEERATLLGLIHISTGLILAQVMMYSEGWANAEDCRDPERGKSLGEYDTLEHAKEAVMRAVTKDG